MSNATSDNKRFPSLLAEALDMPALDHNQHHNDGSEYDGDDYDYDCDYNIHEEEGNTMPPPPPETQRSSPPHPSNELVRTMSSFDTPLIKNHIVPMTAPTTELYGSGIPGIPLPPNPMNSTHSVQSISSCGTNSGSFSINDDTIPRHSDYTVPTSNFYYKKIHSAKRNGETPGESESSSTTSTMEPPLAIAPEPTHNGGGGGGGGGGQQRSILGTGVAKKYHCTETDRRVYVRIPIPNPQNHDIIHNNNNNNNNYGSTMDNAAPPLGMVATPGAGPGAGAVDVAATGQHPDDGIPVHSTTTEQPSHRTRRSSWMTPKIIPVDDYPDYADYYDGIVGSEQPPLDGMGSDGFHPSECQALLSSNSSGHRGHHHHHHRQHHHRQHHHHHHSEDVHSGLHESVHAQSLLVGLAFMVIWLPNNAMAPNLTQMADFFGMNESQRDLYLGSYCALALGVFSLPLSGMIGFMADFYSRKHLFLACCILGALASAWSGWSSSYWSLFVARLCSGGCMSGSVPVAFSLLGDLFSKEERNAASSGLTSMMGLGIILGQIYAGEVGPSKSWQYPFYASAVVQLIMATMIALWVEEPIRGGKEHALQGVLKAGIKYERRLTLNGFVDTMSKNASNWILLWYGFFTSLPWGIVFVFLNDYLSQEKGFTVEEATFLVMLFGVGCAIGGVTGGYLGQLFMKGDRSFLPLYMGAATFFGIFPFLILLNSHFQNHNGYSSKFYSLLGGCIASLPSVNVRPCIINVNPPESRGAALTAANLFVTLGRGTGPLCITLLGSIFAASRQSSFSITLSVFWTIAAIQLLFLAKTLPRDQDRMEEGLVLYAAAAQVDAMEGGEFSDEDHRLDDDSQQHQLQQQLQLQQRTMSPLKRESDASLIASPRTPDGTQRGSIRSANDDDEDDRFYDTIMTSPLAQYMTIDGKSARQSLQFVKLGIQEFGDEINHRNIICRGCENISPCSSQDQITGRNSPLSAMSMGDGNPAPGMNHSGTGRLDSEFVATENNEEPIISEAEIQRRRDIWRQQQHKQQQQQKE